LNESLLNALLALRKAAVQLSIDANPAQKAQLDIMATVIAKLIVERRDMPAMRAAWRDAMSRLSLPPADSKDMRTLAAAAVKLAVDSEKVIMAEMARNAAIYAGGNPQNEAFDRERFRDYLVREVGESPQLEIAEVRLASRGFSKKTVLVELRQARVLPQAIALRIDRPFNFLGTTVVDEFAPLVALHRAGVCLPKPHALESTGKVLDGPFIIFDRMPGVLVGNNFQAPARNPALAADVALRLAQLHRTPIATVGAIRGADRASREQIRQELDKSHGHWRALKRDIPVMDAAFSWLFANLELADSEQAVVHGDYNFNNILVDGDRVSAIVDWEFVQVGNPAMDLGWFYLGAEGVCGWDEFLRLYRAAGGRAFDPRQLEYFKLLGQTRLAVMTLQTESGFDEGRFDDIKFGVSGALFTHKSLQRVGTLLGGVC
jgi:aminoglycoside phosphotransferase (APT) family kinase protein